MTRTYRPGFVDPRATRFGGWLTSAAAAAVALTGSAAAAAVLAALLLAAAAGGSRWSLWGHAYRWTVRRWLAAPTYLEPEAPPRFAQLLGGVLVAAAAGLFAWGLDVAGRGAAAVVGGLALLNAAADVCVGCRLYGLLVRPRGARGGHPGAVEPYKTPATGVGEGGTAFSAGK